MIVAMTTKVSFVYKHGIVVVITGLIAITLPLVKLVIAPGCGCFTIQFFFCEC